jgi:hypothetical protein
MKSELSITLSPDGLVSGFRYHDGRLVEVKRVGADVEVLIQSADGEVTTRIKLEKVSFLAVDDDLSDSIIGYIFLQGAENASAIQRRADLVAGSSPEAVRIHERTEPEDGDWLFTIEAIMGPDLLATCKSVSAFIHL